MIDLRGRVALVTGGGRGIGAAVCRTLGRCGAHVAVNYRRNAEAAMRVVAAVEAAGGRSAAFAADLAEPSAARTLVADVEATLGPLDALVVNHGIWKRAPIHEMSEAQWAETRAVNLDGAVAVVRAAVPGLRQRGRGAIVLISSTAGQRGEASYAHYAATKGALLALTYSLASELAPHGIRVNAVAPGWVMSDMTRDVLEAPEAATERLLIPVGRFGTPEDVAGPVAFLVSDLASFVHGEVLAVNGGSVMVD